ncbi:DUF4282 domain-containing protein [Thalassotalea sp. LPB0316]|uniref:DUF4282 domain-containing protein n=1 Tax=Thalassotalea sp. LPB0316 TaxID=2769490 RepID=UPI00186760B9|nr:DUF4282 domain-containing protein [Thalassotalea sp. LPB0316]QOL24957.1 DUF4282 domain-containing protein [Thalassotalea sp. LPB0316]
MKSIFFFDTMLTPKIITAVYWLILLVSLVSGISEMTRMHGNVFSGLGIALAGAIGGRIWCELMIVLFKIHENLHQLAESAKTSSTQSPVQSNNENQKQEVSE